MVVIGSYLSKAEGLVTDVAEFVRTRLGFEPDAKQEQLLTATAKRLLVNSSRQWGKTTIVALRAVYELYRRKGFTVVVVGRQERHAAEFVRKAVGFLSKLNVVTAGDAGNRLGRVLPNGSRIIGMASGEAGSRGLSADMLVLDEAAWVSDAVYEAVLPMIAATQGSLWVMSTPNGKRGFFWEEWMRGEGWERLQVKATECPRITAEFLEEMRRKRGDDYVRRAFLCEFVAPEDRMFDRDDLEALIAPNVLAFRGNYGLFRQEREFVVGVDLGKLTDYSAIVILERMVEGSGIDPVSMEIRYRKRNVVRHLARVKLGTSYPRVVELVKGLVRELNASGGRCAVVVDSTGVGEAVVDSMRLAGMNCDLAPVTITGGDRVTTGGGRFWVPKKEVIVGLQGMVVRRELEIAVDLPMRDEFVEEMVGIGRSLQAEDGGHDDLVMAVALAAWRVRSLREIGEMGRRVV